MSDSSDGSLFAIAGIAIAAWWLWTETDLRSPALAFADGPTPEAQPPSRNSLDVHPDQSNAVAIAKSQLENEGIDLLGPCGAFAIIDRAVRIMGGGAGFLAKDPPHNNCNGFAVDIVCYPDGAIFDALKNAETDNTPCWNVPSGGGWVDPALYRSP